MTFVQQVWHPPVAAFEDAAGVIDFAGLMLAPFCYPSVIPIWVARFAIDDQTSRRDLYRIMTIDRGRLVEWRMARTEGAMPPFVACKRTSTRCDNLRWRSGLFAAYGW